jgi:hypothetical protein
MTQQTRDDSSVHIYNDPDLSATEFLQAVRDDSSVPLMDRIDAARYLIFIDQFPGILDQIAKFGEARFKEMFDELPEAERNEITNQVNGLLRCNSLGIDRPLDWLPVKGHA